jgi:hypothetical protein
MAQSMLLSCRGATCMSDLIYVLVTLIFFALGAAYVRGCERL